MWTIERQVHVSQQSQAYNNKDPYCIGPQLVRGNWVIILIKFMMCILLRLRYKNIFDWFSLCFSLLFVDWWTCSFGKIFDEFHSFASELNRAADVVVLSETLFSANTCHDVQGYTGFHTYRADKTGGGVSVFIRNCYTSTHMANFSVGHAYYEISVAKVSLSNSCTVIIIDVYRPPDKSKIPEFTIKLNEILSST